MLKPTALEIAKAFGLYQDGVYFTRCGPDDASQRLWLSAGTHGQEIAGPLALAELVQPGKWKWPHVSMVATFSDPEGYDREGYGFVGLEGNESCWPPLWGYRQDGKGYWNYYDRNSLWGNTDTATLPLSHHAERMAMDIFEPTFVLSLHETVRSEVERDAFWVGAGLLVIETWPASAAEMNAVLGVSGSLSATAFDILYSWIKSVLGVPQWRVAARALGSNPRYRLVSEIVSRYEQKGGKMTGERWMKYLALFLPGDLIVGPGRILHGPLVAQAEWKTITDYALGLFGCPGITTETFQAGEVGLRGIEQRVSQQLAFAEATLDVLETLACAS